MPLHVDTIAMQLAHRIRHLRESRQWLQKELADRVGVSVQTVSFWEQGRCPPDGPNRRSLCRVFGITEADLFQVEPINRLPEDRVLRAPSLPDLTPDEARLLSAILQKLRQGALDPARPPTPSTAGKSVLICDDEAKLCYLFSRALSPLNVRVEFAFDGRQALRKLTTDHFEPTVILLDLRMPEMNGVQFLKRLRRVNHEAKVIVYSAYPHELTDLSMSGLRYEAIFEKPVELPTVLAKIEELLRSPQP